MESQCTKSFGRKKETVEEQPGNKGESSSRKKRVGIDPSEPVAKYGWGKRKKRKKRL